MSEKRIVVLCGSFDGDIHPGHVFFLKQAKRYGDSIYAFVSTDAEIRKLKFRIPLYTQEERMRHVMQTGLVDKVIACELDHTLNIQKILALKPAVYVFGGDQIGDWADKLEHIFTMNNIDVVRLYRDPHSYSTTKQIAQAKEKRLPSIRNIVFDWSGVCTFGDAQETIRVNNEIMGLIKKLKEHYNTFLFIDTYEGISRTIKRKHKLDDLFNAMVIMDNASLKNSDSSMFETLKINPEISLLIDDRKANTEAAKHIGFDTILFDHFNQLLEELHTRNLLY